MELVSTTSAGGGTLLVTLADATGLTRLEASRAEIAALSDALEEAALLARASPRIAWLGTLRAGGDTVRVGIGRGRVRVLVGPAG